MRIKRKVKYKEPRFDLMKQIAGEIRSRHPGPLIAAIGAGDPDKPYTIPMGMKAGYGIAEYIDDNYHGTLFTGGMNGVGADIFVGVTRYRMHASHGQPPVINFRHFFVLIPERETHSIMGFGEFIEPFQESYSYRQLAALTGDDIIRERAGDSLEERRICLAHTADFAVCLNGTGGTLDEAAMILQHGKPVITCAESGGVSEALQTYKTYLVGNFNMKLKWLEKMMNVMPFGMNPDLIVTTDTVEEAVEAVKRQMKGGTHASGNKAGRLI
jgi:hypothetical protein